MLYYFINSLSTYGLNFFNFSIKSFAQDNNNNKAVLQEKKIFLRIRSSGSAGKSYHDITLSEAPNAGCNFFISPSDASVAEIISVGFPC